MPTNEVRFGNIDFQFSSRGATRSGRERENTSFHLLVMGDLSGRGNRAEFESDVFSSRRVFQIDRDDFDEVMAKTKPRLELKFADAPGLRVALTFEELDDFTPDNIFERLDLFSELRTLRSQLRNDATFEKAAARIEGAADAVSSPTNSTAQGGTDIGPAELLSSAVDATASRQRDYDTRDSLQNYISTLVKSFIIDAPDRSRQAALIASVDDAISEQMRRILHHPDFQALESLWRGIYMLVRRINTSTQLKLFVVDAAKQELRDDLLERADLSEASFYRILIESKLRTSGEIPWAAMVADYVFDATVEDAEVLARIARLVAVSGTAFTANADCHLIGCDSFAGSPSVDDWAFNVDDDVASAWSQLRNLPESRYLALLMPRFLVRLPYGAKTSPCEQFRFEEFLDTPVHESLLWSNSGLLAGLKLAVEFSKSDWNLEPDSTVEIDRLPYFSYTVDDETVAQPCAEVVLNERGGQHIRNNGFVPVWAVRNQDVVRIGPLYSMNNDSCILQGRWSPAEAFTDYTD